MHITYEDSSLGRYLGHMRSIRIDEAVYTIKRKKMFDLLLTRLELKMMG